MIGVVGAGAFGTALAITLAARSEVRLWARSDAAVARMQTHRDAPRLPGVTLPETVQPTSSLADLRGATLLVLAVPMQSLGALLPLIAPLSPGATVAACKGIDLATLTGPTTVIGAHLPEVPAAVLSGPSFAKDIAGGLPTALALGCADDGVGASLQAALSTPTLRLYRTTDTMGVELGGALKNVIAIACGAAMGAGLGESARAALMTRGMAEMMRLATCLGARAETLMGLSGLGDLALTCASPASRNYALGQAIGAGTPRPAATTEGVATATAALALARKHGLDLPVTAATVALVAGDLTVENAMADLLARDLTTEDAR
ncbi:glycerol-3-phosphate dehydrogenase [NAD(P)+] [Jannaschia pagri]|uniref:Glycerol-3-phosphate dehydrogenase [NAD(P)+] n=1 Tax=Jannaschia pagri TaxID=2829797 RepID=A0ABQ4NQW3_9RHOB|nr:MULTISPECIES: NAD(P)H-dependent glycerol-3-phosphate dehydrogenase [unclassified Jannaschia]GIT92955.1 glycerol-3-phosphate dehydrogenase [NAD(P)+] [Jannaschia sp. AI_61]GIT96790.1 glycerol-3-phosphate dehydrogenase [NAD(P)+] [Jannaschia sp. AI_62]